MSIHPLLSFQIGAFLSLAADSEPAVSTLVAMLSNLGFPVPKDSVRGPVAQWTRHLTTNQGIAGSSPARIKLFFAKVSGDLRHHC